MIVKKKLPNGRVPIAEIRDPIVRDKIMKVNENIASLHSQISALQDVVIELLKKVR